MYVTRKDLFGPDPTLNTDPDPIFWEVRTQI